MADTVNVQTLVDANHRVVVLLTGISDGTGESAVVKVDVSALDAAPDEVVVEKIKSSCSGEGVDLLWDATANVMFWHCAADTADCVEFDRASPLTNNAGAGKTGDILLTTVGGDAGDRYSILLFLRKKFNNS